ncbi:MAG TPA: hypothetical protein VGB45_05825, partial [Abditibacterium sp.]
MKPQFLLPILALAFAGCSAQNTDNTASNSTSEAPKKEFKVGLLTPGDTNDQGWNQLAGEGLEG